MAQPNQYERVLRVVARHFLFTQDVTLEFNGLPPLESPAEIGTVMEWWPANEDARLLLSKFEKESKGERRGTFADVVSAIKVAAADCGYGWTMIEKGKRWTVAG